VATERLAASPGHVRLAAQLGIQAAEALEHAHQLGIVHRDVKPANLLVDGTGHLWVTDFGLAQFHEDAGLTRTGDVMGTLRYMSPEQARARHAVVDQRTDVYSLGVTPYELLTLEPAFAGQDRHELLLHIAWEEPRPPRRLNKAVPAELEVIVLKAMEKDPAERYTTAQELADDLRRFLEDRPIHARRPTLVQRARKWTRRHRALVGAAVVAMFLTTVAAVVSSVLVWRAARTTEAALQAEAEQKQRAETALQGKAEHLRLAQDRERSAYEAAEFSVYITEKVLANRPHMDQEARTILEWLLPIYQKRAREPGADPVSRVQTGLAYRRVGTIQQKLGRYAEAEEAYGRALDLLEPLASRSPAMPLCRYELAETLNDLGGLLMDTGRPRAAEKCLRRSLALYQQLGDPSGKGPSRELLDALRAGLPRAAEEAWRSKVFRHQLSNNYYNLGLVLAAARRHPEARKAYEEARALLEKLAGEEPAEPKYRFGLAVLHDNLGELLRAEGRGPAAEQAYRRALDVARKLADDFRTTPAYRHVLADCHYHLGILLADAGRFAGGEKEFRQALQLRQQLADDFPATPNYRHGLALSHDALGNVLAIVGRFAEAENAYRQAQPLLEKLAAGSPAVVEYRHQLARTCFNLGNLLELTGRPGLAEKPLRQALALLEKLPADQVLDVRGQRAAALNSLGVVLRKTGRLQEAGEAYRQAIALWEEVVDALPDKPDAQSNLAGTLANLARLLNSQGEGARARPLVERAIRCQHDALKRRPQHPPYRRLLREHSLLLADTQLGLGAHTEAARTAAEVVREFPSSWKATYGALDVLAACVVLVEKDDQLSPAERKTHRQAYADRIQTLLRELVRQGGKNPAAGKALARFLALWPLSQGGDPRRAVVLAKQVHDRSPVDGPSWTTMGIACYRVGLYPQTITTLEIGLKCGSDSDGLSGFFLAMAHWRQGDKDKAVRRYQRAAEWMNNHQPDSRVLRRVRAEAAALLGQSK
jgi:tetratricopeptide (TPR) repeat protein